jgi:hypothetical protein
MDEVKQFKQPTERAKFTASNIVNFFILGALFGFIAYAIVLMAVLVAHDFNSSMNKMVESLSFIGLMAAFGHAVSFVVVFIFGKDEVKTGEFMVDNEVELCRIDGCQYIGFKTYYGHRAYTHKGNCDNPIHQR